MAVTMEPTETYDVEQHRQLEEHERMAFEQSFKGYQTRRKALVNHFSVAYNKREVKWPLKFSDVKKRSLPLHSETPTAILRANNDIVNAQRILQNIT